MKDNEFLRKIIVPKLNAVFIEQLKYYRAIFGRSINLDFLEILYKAKSIQDGNRLLADLFK